MQCLSINTDVEVVKTKPTQYCKVKIKHLFKQQKRIYSKVHF